MAASCNRKHGLCIITGLFFYGGLLMEYLSIRQTSEKWGISTRRIQILCSEERIPGAVRIGYSWAIPADAEKPKDARIRSGKYVKHEK
jgi:hypothetical protein